MKKRYIAMACVAFGIAIFATGCKKDEVKETFNLNAIIEEVNGGQKVHMENLLPVWDNNDEIRVNNENCMVSITGTGNSRTNSIAKEVEENTYCAVYPASYLTNQSADITSASNISITLPRTQDYVVSGGNQIVRMPMIAYSNTTDLYFKNLCSVLKVTVTNSIGYPFKLDSIKVTSEGGNLCGTGSVSLNGFTSVYTPAGLSLSGNGAGKVVTLCRPNETSMNVNVANNASKIFYIVVPVVSTSDIFRIRLYIEEGFVINKKTNSSKPVDRNKLINMPISAIKFEHPIDVIIGPFTVDANGTKVCFSTGNLWYSRDDNNLGGDGKFHFETHQYDYTSIPRYGFANTVHISYFWWDINASTATGDANYCDDDGLSSTDCLFTNSSFTMANPTFEVEGVRGKFRTLSNNEWRYLTSRSFLTSNGYAVVKLTDVNKWGLVILPDPATNVNPATLTTMAAITAAGAAFLPEAGGRVNQWDGNYTYNEEVNGGYWASDNIDQEHAQTFTFAPGSVYTASGSHVTGRTIRLVCNAAPTTRP